MRLDLSEFYISCWVDFLKLHAFATLLLPTIITNKKDSFLIKKNLQSKILKNKWEHARLLIQRGEGAMPWNPKSEGLSQLME